MSLPVEKVELAPGIHWVGVEDWQRRLFDALVPLPSGTSYNAYLVVGKEKSALIDSVAPGFEEEFLEKVASIVPPESIDYVVMNHAEPDHASAIARVLSLTPGARLVATKKGKAVAASMYRIQEDRCMPEGTTETLDLGGKTLKFIEAPWLHWPETMFTFAVEDRILFTCDFFGAHMASARLFDDEVGDGLLAEAKRYYAEIMMPFAKLAASGLDKAAAANPAVIAPSHGPVYRDPQRIMQAYDKWIRGPLAAKAVVVWASMWGATGRLAKAVMTGLSDEGIEVVPYDLTVADTSHIARDLVDASAIVLGSPTVLGGLHPLAAYALSLVKALRPRVKVAAFIGSYGWGGGAAAQAKGLLEPAGFEIVGAVDVRGTPGEQELSDAVQLGRTIAKRIKESLR